MNAVVPAKFIFRQAFARCLPRGGNGQRGSSSAEGPQEVAEGAGIATCFLRRVINPRFGETIACPSLLAPREGGEGGEPSAAIIPAA